MPLITDYHQVKETYREAAELGAALPTFCAEDRETLEAILASAVEIGKEIGVDNLPIVPAWTSRYPSRGQMTLISASGDAVLGTNLMFSDLETFMGDSSPYRNLRVMPHLDHAFPWIDEDILLNYTDKFASVMYDASEKSFEENIRMTAAYVEKVRGQVVVEGAVDEIFEAGGEGSKNEPTTADQAEEFVRRTGVDLIVPNVGTEHRATENEVKYRSDRAKEISAKTGKIMCIHGTSSVEKEMLSSLPGDGFVKINIYTTLAVHGGQALARQVLDNLGNIFNEDQIRELINTGVLGDAVLGPDYAQTISPIKPKLAYVTNPMRRDAWFDAVKDRCKEFLDVFNYGRYAK